MQESIKLTPVIDYEFALELTRSNMNFYYQKHNIQWEDHCFATNWQKSENFGVYLKNQCIGVLRQEHDLQATYLADLQIKSDLQGQGIGNFILNYVKQLAQIRKKNLVSLVVFLDNPALFLYQRHGFSITQKNEVLARMECPLTQPS